MLTSALGANCILCADPGEGFLKPGDSIKINLLPWAYIYMIITPVELKQWLNDGKNFKIFDIRPRDQIIEIPITELNHKTGSLDSIKNLKNQLY